MKNRSRFCSQIMVDHYNTNRIIKKSLMKTKYKRLVTIFYTLQT